jgi:anaphase-promoting complex subunit 5
MILLRPGCDKLAQIEEDIVTLFTEVGGDDNSTLIVALNRAYRVRLFKAM